MEDIVNHPKHYVKCAVTVEPIELTSRLDSCLGQAINYVMRSNFKGSKKEDLEKAIFYLEREKKLCEDSNYNFGENKTFVTYEAIAFAKCFIVLSNDQLTKNVLTALFESVCYEYDEVVSLENLEKAIKFIKNELELI